MPFTILGRTCGGWFKILFFYVIFYACLAGFFIGSIQLMLMTLSPTRPKWQDLIRSPGLTFVTSRFDRTEVSFNANDLDSYMGYTAALRNFLIQYDDENQRDPNIFHSCGEKPDSYRLRPTETEYVAACRFSRSLLGPCSGIDDHEFGYRHGQPCIIVKLNRIINFLPEPLTWPDGIPEEAQARMQPNVIPLHCTTKREEEADKLGEVRYYGIGQGFPLQYYPYYGRQKQPFYLQPLVAVQFVNITQDYELRIECRVFAENIHHSVKDHIGRFDFKLTVRSDQFDYN